MDLLKNEEIAELANFDILAASELSDTIVGYCYNCGDFMDDNKYFATRFYNMRTKETSTSFFDVLTDNHFIFIKWYERPVYKKGILTKFFPERNVLLAVIYRLKNDNLPENSSNDDLVFSWEEICRVVISPYAFTCIKVTENGFERCVYDSNHFDDFSMAYDLCGQFIYPQYVVSYECPVGYNIPLNSGEEARTFCDGLMRDCFGEFFFQHNLDITRLLNAIYDDDDIIYGIESIGVDNIPLEDIKLPEEIMSKLSKTAKEYFELCCQKSWDKRRMMLGDFFYGLLLGMVENVNGNYVLRTFVISACGNAENDMMPMKIFERGRILLSENALRNIEKIHCPIIYFDMNDIENSPFKYVVNYIKKAEEVTRSSLELKVLKNKPTWDTPIFGISSKVLNDTTISFACAMAFCPFFEKLYNMLYAKSEDISFFETALKEMSFLKNNICNDYDYNLYLNLELIFGVIYYNEDELHKNIGVSKPLFNELIQDEKIFKNINLIRGMFLDNPEIQHMNKEKAKKLCNILINVYRKENFQASHFISCINKITSIFGKENIFKYLDFVFSEYVDNLGLNLSLYENYIERLDVIKTHINLPDDKWKVKADELVKANESIYESYVMLNDLNEHEETLRKFKTQEYEWKKYLYSDETFMVVYPKGPTDIIEEGFKLNHCVEHFISAVADGHTIILFIRRKDAPLKPFYTLEIRDKTIRQCHGFDNCNVDECEGLMDFVIAFSREKKINIPSSLNRALGAD